MPDTVDQKYYEAVPPRGVAERLLVAARDRIYEDFLLQMSPEPTDTILDVGVSDVLNDGANVLERKYDYKEQIVACGIGSAEEFQQSSRRCVMSGSKQTSRCRSMIFGSTSRPPTPSLSMSGAGSNQKLFVAELCRVAKRVFISVPHRYFPVEHHTAIPFLHYWDMPFRVACSLVGKRRMDARGKPRFS